MPSIDILCSRPTKPAQASSISTQKIDFKKSKKSKMKAQIKIAGDSKVYITSCFKLCQKLPTLILTILIKIPMKAKNIEQGIAKMIHNKQPKRAIGKNYAFKILSFKVSHFK